METGWLTTGHGIVRNRFHQGPVVKTIRFQELLTFQKHPPLKGGWNYFWKVRQAVSVLMDTSSTACHDP
jgi:hypothetical protein